MKTIEKLRTALEAEPARSAWKRGVKEYALELIEEMDDGREFYGSPADWKALLNGASDWQQYSDGGCALIYDSDIAERLCSPSELKKCRGGDWAPNRRETWIDVQARALKQAARMVCRLAREGDK